MKRKKAKKINDRDVTAKARQRVLKAARKRGHITNAQARDIGDWSQAWYHLTALVKDKQLKKDGYNRWVPGRRA